MLGKKIKHICRLNLENGNFDSKADILYIGTPHAQTHPLYRDKIH